MAQRPGTGQAGRCSLLGVWGMGDIMIIFLAALLDVPIEQYEAADLDGAGPVQQFRYITLPNLSPVLLFAAITGVIDALQYFTQAAVASALASGVATTGGGTSSSLGYPDGATLTYPLWLYQMGFQNFYLGYACAMAVILLVIEPGVRVVHAAPVGRLPRHRGPAMTAVEVEVRGGAERLDERSPRRRGRRNERLLGIAEHSVAILLTAVFLGPIVLIVLTAFMTSGQTLTSDLWPHEWQLVELPARCSSRPPFLTWLKNSLVYSVLATGFMLLSSFPAAYALARACGGAGGTWCCWR